jgi:hypothetical protein
MKLTNATLLFLAALLSGCVGAGAIHTKKKSLEHFRFTSLDSDFKVIVESDSEINPAKDEIIEKWGDPDKIKQEKENLIWVYETGTRWAGAVPMVGIGVPLAVPTGKDKTEFYFSLGSDRPHSAIVYYTSWSGGYYGPGDTGTMENGFHKLQD